MKRAMHTMTTCLLAALLLGAWCAPARGDAIRLRTQATIDGDQVRLGDVAELEGADIEAHAMLVVAAMPAGRDRLELSMDALRRALREADVNLARVTFSGRLRCGVQRNAAAPIPVGAEAAAGSSDTASNAPLPPDGPTVRTRLSDLLVDLAGVTDIEELRFEFTDASDILDRPLGADRYELHPLATAIPGRVPVVVRRFEGASQVVAEESRVLADVQRRYPAVVATRRITRGNAVTADDVAIEPVFLRGGPRPLTDLDAVIGQAASGTLRPGDALMPASIEAPRLVRRGDQLVVRCVVGNLMIRLTGTAMDDGGRDAVIRVRNASSRETFLARVLGPHEAELVRESSASVSEAP